jgi:hypothetical protein
MRQATQELRDATVRAFLDQIQQPCLAGPPVDPPPAPLPAKQPKQHHVVCWHRNPLRVTKVLCETWETAYEYAHSLHPAAFYRYAIMCGRDTIETRALELEAVS